MAIELKYINTPPKTFVDRLNKSLDYHEHNVFVKDVMSKFNIGEGDKIPLHIGINPRFILLDSTLNKQNISFKDYTFNSRLMFEITAEFDYWCNHYIPRYKQMGDKLNLMAYGDFQNFNECMFLGAKIKFSNNDVPAIEPLINQDNLNYLFDKGLPNPISGINQTSLQYYEDFLKYSKDYEIDGAHVTDIRLGCLSTDGPFTIACELMTPTLACIMLYEDRDYMLQLLDYITTSIIERIKALQKNIGNKEKNEDLWMADDSIAMLSTGMYNDVVLPFHRKIVTELLSSTGKVHIHLCGDATRHYQTIQKELNCQEFDTGFPVKHGELCATLNKGTLIWGGPSVPFLSMNNEDAIKNEIVRIINDVKPVSNTFIMREGNNLPPKFDLNKILTMYETVRKFG